MLTHPVDRRLVLVLLGAIIAISAAIRLIGINAQSLWYDEAASLAQSDGTLLEVYTRTAMDNYPPLHNLLLWVVTHTLGSAEWALRLPSLLLGVLNVWVLYALAARLEGRMAGLLAALLLALSAYHIYYSVEARMYALLAFASTLFALAVVEDLKAEQPRLAWRSFLAAVALFYSHPFGILNWAAILAGAWLAGTVSPTLWRRPAISLWLGQSLAVLVFLPWIWVLLGRARVIGATGFWIERPTLVSVARALHMLASGSWTLLVVAAGVLAAVAAAVGSARRGTTGLRGVILFLGVWALLPGVIAFVGSIAGGTPFFLPRYLIGGLPAGLALCAIGLARFGVTGARLAAAVGAIVVTSVAGIAFDAPPQHSPWREVAAYIEQHAEENDACVLVAPKTNAMPVDYYLDDRCALGVNGAPDLAKVELDPGPAVVVVNTAGTASNEMLFARYLGRESRRRVFKDITVHLFGGVTSAAARTRSRADAASRADR